MAEYREGTDKENHVRKVPGVFKAGDVTSFVDIVTSYLPVRAVRASDGEIRLQSNG
jgi:ferric-dicitrate binding protein FerR (iron transport regulator)